MSKYPLETIARYQQTSLLGYNYEQPGAVERQYSPYGYATVALGAASAPFDLNGKATVELKRALLALAQHGADPFRNPADPITERVWQSMLVDGEYADAWDGPSSDELVTALSRYASGSGIPGPHTFLRASAAGRYGINGGPQPTAAGLEVIAGAVQSVLGGIGQMTEYMKWRDAGHSADAVVLPNRKTAWDQGDPEWLALVDETDDNLISCWNIQLGAPNEQLRAQGLSECIGPARAARDAAAAGANQGKAIPSCQQFEQWDFATGRCVRMAGVVDLDEVTPTDQMCLDAYKTQGKTDSEARSLCNVPGSALLAGMALPLAVGVAVGGGLWWLQKRRSGR
jgi:hypothetical protein